jgi:hypothetical protein
MSFENTINSYWYVWLILTPLLEELTAKYKNIIKVHPRTCHEG